MKKDTASPRADLTKGDAVLLENVYDLPKVQPQVAQIGWTHNLTIFQRYKDDLEREFYPAFRNCQTISNKLTGEYGWGFSRSNLFNMTQFAEMFNDFQIVRTLSAQLSWSLNNEARELKEQIGENVTLILEEGYENG